MAELLLDLAHDIGAVFERFAHCDVVGLDTQLQAAKLETRNF